MTLNLSTLNEKTARIFLPETKVINNSFLRISQPKLTECMVQLYVLNHSKQVSDLLKIYMTKNNIDIALLQDPYTYNDNNNLPGLPNNWINFNSDIPLHSDGSVNFV